MAIDEDYHRAERMLTRVAVVVAIVIAILAFILSERLGQIPEQTVSEEEVWAYIQEQSAQAKIDPEFVYAIAWAESGLDPGARSSMARGMMQLSRVAWLEVTDESYSQAWDWRTNIRVGVAYLAHCKEFLLQRGEFTYPMLAACYRYGPYYVQDKKFTTTRMKTPKNKIYKRIFSGDIHPVEPPANVSGSPSPESSQ